MEHIMYEIDQGDERLKYSLVSYIEKSLKNARINLERKRVISTEPLDMEEIADNETEPFGSDVLLLEMINNENLLKSLLMLTEKQRQALILYCVEGFTYNEIAKIMNVRRQSVITHVKRAIEEITLMKNEILRM